MVITETGGADAVINGELVRHQAGSLVAVAGGFDLDERGDAQQSWHARWIVCEGPWAESLGSSLRAHRGALLAVPRAPRPWPAQLRAVESAITEGRPGWEWRTMAHLATLFEAIGRLAGQRDAAAGLEQQLAAIIDEAPERDWTLVELAAELGISRSSLAHRFACEVGTPPARFIRQRRCEHARRLLGMGQRVGAVAERLGFLDQFQFSRCYRQVMGEPPSRVGRISGWRS